METGASKWRAPLLIVSALTALMMALAWWLDPTPPAHKDPAPPTKGSAATSPSATVMTTTSQPTALASGPQPSSAPSVVMTAVPFDPPKPGAPGAGDDFAESGLPRVLWDGWAGLQARAPTDKHLAAAAALLKRPVTEAEKKSLLDSFTKNDERAQIAIGKYRQKLWTEEQADTQIRDAARVYRKRVTEVLAISEQEFDQVFGR